MQKEETRHQISSGFPLPPATHRERQSAIFNQCPHFCTTLGQNQNQNQNQIHQTQATSDGRRRNNKDMEPGRCKRTDGKKWRCSKAAVAPNHKYCDRHLNRGRTRRRSRKLVEAPQPTTAPDLSNFSPIASTSTTASASAYPLFIDLLPAADDGDDAYFPSFSYPEPISGMEVVSSFEDEWNQLLLKDMGFMTAGLTYDCSVFRQDLETPTGFIETSQISTVSSDSSFSNSLTPSMDPTDNLLVANKRRQIVSSDKDLNINAVDQEEDDIDDDHNGLKSIWSSVSDGGPLAEALRPCLPFWGSNPVE